MKTEINFSNRKFVLQDNKLFVIKGQTDIVGVDLDKVVPGTHFFVAALSAIKTVDWGDVKSLGSPYVENWNPASEVDKDTVKNALDNDKNLVPFQYKGDRFLMIKELVAPGKKSYHVVLSNEYQEEKLRQIADTFSEEEYLYEREELESSDKSFDELDYTDNTMKLLPVAAEFDRNSYFGNIFYRENRDLFNKLSLLSGFYNSLASLAVLSKASYLKNLADEVVELLKQELTKQKKAYNPMRITKEALRQYKEKIDKSSLREVMSSLKSKSLYPLVVLMEIAGEEGFNNEEIFSSLTAKELNK